MNIPLILDVEQQEPAAEQTSQEPAANAEVTQHQPEFFNQDFVKNVVTSIIIALIVSYIVK